MASSSSNNRSKAGFGRDDMVALLGGGISDTLASVAIKQNAANLAPNKKDQETDLSQLTSAEAAVLLQSSIGTTSAAAAASRLRAHRPKKVLQHHILLEEAQADIAQFVEEHQLDNLKNEKQDKGDKEDDDDNVEREFVVPNSRRQRQEPQIILQRQQPQPSQQPPLRKRPRHDSSSESDEEETRQKSDSDDDDDDDSETDQRRQRLLAKRRQQQQQKQTETEEKLQKGDATVQPQPATNGRQPLTRQRDTPQVEPRKDRSSSESDEDSSSSSSSSEDESSVEQVKKPLFVPKHRRNVVLSKEDAERQEEEKEERAKQQIQQRVMESRGLVEQQRIMAKANGAADMTPMDVILLQDEGGGATNNPPPDDTDPTNPEDVERERDEWEVRELKRLFELMDANLERLQTEEGANERDQEERRKRHLPPTRKERKQMQEEVFIRPKQETGDDKAKNFLQPFFHRGAYYMDESEFEDPNDVRFKAKEYAQAATGDKAGIDPRTLPKVMQVKKFGFARQNTKYKGLAQEDTTDFKQETLPIRDNKQPSNYHGKASKHR